jgi:D-inositol-3-phosphate glycosyltransferase
LRESVNLKVVFVLEHFHPYVGGAETLFANLATGLADAGHEVAVVTTRLPGTSTRECWRGVRILRVVTPPFARRYFFMAAALPAVLRLAVKCDVIHTTTYNAALPAALGGILRRRPVVITVHEVFGRQWHRLPGMNPLIGFGYRLFEWSVLHLPFARYICDSHFTRRRLLDTVRMPPSRALTVYPILDHTFWSPDAHRPLDLRRELNLSPGTFIYMYFGRPGVSKGVEYLVAAAERVHRQLPSSRLVMLLSDDPPGQYRRILGAIADQGLAEHVILLRPVPRRDLPRYLLAADCVVVPSLSEGFGYSALEAASIGCRVVVTSGHASEEVLNDVAEFVPPRDPLTLAEKILEISQRHPSKRLLPRRFEAAEHVREITDIYREVLREQ